MGQPSGKAGWQSWVGPEDRFRTSVGVVGCLQCPGCCSAPDPAGQIARGVVNVGRPVVEHQSTKGSGGPRGYRGLTRGGRGDFWLAISETILWGDWQPSSAR